MEIILDESPQGVTIIQGFPGFGMVGSISTEFLIDHMKMRRIGHVHAKELEPLVAVHNGVVLPPVGIYYSQDNNVVVLNFITKGAGHEWDFAKLVKSISEKLSAKEIIAVEGVASQVALEDKKLFVLSSDSQSLQKLEEKGFSVLQNGIVMGVSAAMFLDKPTCPMVAFFALTSSTLPDSNASAEIIKGIDSYLGLSVDYNPLYQQAQVFEEKIKTILSQSKQAVEDTEKSMINYVS